MSRLQVSRPPPQTWGFSFVAKGDDWLFRNSRLWIVGLDWEAPKWGGCDFPYSAS